MKKSLAEKMISVCCVLLLLNAAAAAAQDSTALLPERKVVGPSKNVLQAKRVSKRLKKNMSSFVDSTGCSVEVRLYVETTEEDERKGGFSIIKFVKKAARKNAEKFSFQDEVPALLIMVSWDREESGWYTTNAAALVNGGAISLFPESALDAFSLKIQRYEEKPPIDSMKNTKVDAWILSALYDLYNSSTSTIRKINKKDFLEATTFATVIGNKVNKGGPACNICVRSALLLLKNETALFPATGSMHYDPYNSYKVVYKKGHISGNGQAAYIKADFDNIANRAPLRERFVEQKKSTQDSWSSYFKKLQDEADRGHIIIGVMLDRKGISGHVVMITPGGLVEINEKTQRWGDSYTTQGITKVPRVLECGGEGLRENEAPLCLNVDRKGAQERMKWFKYIK